MQHSTRNHHPSEFLYSLARALNYDTVDFPLIESLDSAKLISAAYVNAYAETRGRLFRDFSACAND